jgi:hypothetical protein
MCFSGFHPFDNSQLESAETERREICKILKYNVEPSEVHFVKSVLKPASKDEAVKCLSGGGYREGKNKNDFSYGAPKHMAIY